MIRPRRVTLGLLLTVCLLAGVDFGVWWVATDRLAAAFGAWRGRLAAAGWQVDSGRVRATGWPLAATITLADPHLTQGGTAGFGLTAVRVTFGVAAWRPHLMSVAVFGPQSVTAFGYVPLRFWAQRLVVAVPLTVPIQTARATATGLAFDVAGGEVDVARVDLHAAWDAGGTRVVVEAGPASLPPSRGAGLAPMIDRVVFNLAVQGALAGGDARTAARAWRDGGGVLVLRQGSLQWGGLTLDATGDAHLDATLQPDAALDVRVNDPAAGLAALSAAGAIDQGTAVAAGAVLQILAIPARLAGQTVALDLPLALKGGAVTLARIPVARVPAVTW